MTVQVQVSRMLIVNNQAARVLGQPATDCIEGLAIAEPQLGPYGVVYF